VIHGLGKNLINVGIDQLEDDNYFSRNQDDHPISKIDKANSKFLPSNEIIIIGRDLWELRNEQVTIYAVFN